MGQTVRFGISLDEKLLQNFDQLIEQKSYMNRSEAIRDLIRASLVEERCGAKERPCAAGRQADGQLRAEQGALPVAGAGGLHHAGALPVEPALDGEGRQVQRSGVSERYIIVGAVEAEQRLQPGTLQQVQRVTTLVEAVHLAAQVARSGEVVLLSPGGTSYDAFKDFAERGDKFQELVQALT